MNRMAKTISTKPTFHTLFVRDFSLFIRLGCEEKERELPQEVMINIELRFFEPPQATETDILEDTICYAKLIQALENYCEGKVFNLLEKLAADLTGVIKEFIAGQAAMSLVVHKVNPPIKNLNGGTQYRIADFQ